MWPVITVYLQISVDKEMVSFGSVCVGEVCKRMVTITNSGALPTTYQLLSPSLVSHKVCIIVDKTHCFYCPSVPAYIGK